MLVAVGLLFLIKKEGLLYTLIRVKLEFATQNFLIL